MGTELDLDDVVAGNPLAERQLKLLRAELKLTEHKCITCGVAAAHPNAELTLRKDYMKWDSPQAQAVRALRTECDKLRAAEVWTRAQAAKYPTKPSAGNTYSAGFDVGYALAMEQAARAFDAVPNAGLSGGAAEGGHVRLKP